MQAWQDWRQHEAGGGGCAGRSRRWRGRAPRQRRKRTPRWGGSAQRRRGPRLPPGRAGGRRLRRSGTFSQPGTRLPTCAGQPPFWALEPHVCVCRLLRQEDRCRGVSNAHPAITEVLFPSNCPARMRAAAPCGSGGECYRLQEHEGAGRRRGGDGGCRQLQAAGSSAQAQEGRLRSQLDAAEAGQAAAVAARQDAQAAATTAVAEQEVRLRMGQLRLHSCGVQEPRVTSPRMTCVSRGSRVRP